MLSASIVYFGSDMFIFCVDLPLLNALTGVVKCNFKRRSLEPGEAFVLDDTAGNFVNPVLVNFPAHFYHGEHSPRPVHHLQSLYVISDEDSSGSSGHAGAAVGDVGAGEASSAASGGVDYVEVFSDPPVAFSKRKEKSAANPSSEAEPSQGPAKKSRDAPALAAADVPEGRERMTAPRIRMKPRPTRVPLYQKTIKAMIGKISLFPPPLSFVSNFCSCVLIFRCG